MKKLESKMCNVLEYLRTYYVYHRIPSQRQDAINLIDSRHHSMPSFENYYPSFFQQMPDYEKYKDKREYCIALGKYNLEMILKVNPNFKDEIKKTILKVEIIKTAKKC